MVCHICKVSEARYRCSKCGRMICQNCGGSVGCADCHTREASKKWGKPSPGTGFLHKRPSDLEAASMLFVLLLFVSLTAMFLGSLRAPSDQDRQASSVAYEDPADIPNPGPKPIASSWDGLTPEVKKYLMYNLKDPRSLEIVECSPVVQQTHCWGQRVRYRAKNSFGGYNLEQRIFWIKNGAVIGSIPFGSN